MTKKAQIAMKQIYPVIQSDLISDRENKSISAIPKYKSLNGAGLNFSVCAPQQGWAFIIRSYLQCLL